MPPRAHEGIRGQAVARSLKGFSRSIAARKTETFFFECCSVLKMELREVQKHENRMFWDFGGAAFAHWRLGDEGLRPLSPPARAFGVPGTPSSSSCTVARKPGGRGEALRSHPTSRLEIAAVCEELCTRLSPDLCVRGSAFAGELPTRCILVSRL